MSHLKILLFMLVVLPKMCLAETWLGYVASPFKGEQVREIQFAEDARAIIVAPDAENFDPQKPTVLVVFATPNGNTAEQTLGCKLTEGLDWHFDIQHVAAQWRLFQKHESGRNTILACVQARNLSWPTWKGERDWGPNYIRQMVEALRTSVQGNDVSVILTGHSGGGSFIFGFLDESPEIPGYVERIAFLDANYGFDASLHGEKILKWVIEHDDRELYILAYDDREIMLDGKKVVGPTGGTFRATNRMLDFLKQETKVDEAKSGEFTWHRALNDQFVALVHPNPKNIILHTRLVGEMNGLVDALTWDTAKHDRHSKLASPRAYSEFVQPKPFNPATWQAEAPALPPRLSDAKPSRQIVKELLYAEPNERERVIAHEILQGNVPDSWRDFVEVVFNVQDTDGSKHQVTLRVSPDYLSVGSEQDYLRVPLTPYTAQLIADITGCILPTSKMVDEIYNAASTKLPPSPLTEDRESLATFLQHHDLIQEKLPRTKKLSFISGIKKDVVISRKLSERADRVAIYGWHQLDGKPIQPLTTVHVSHYVDYSHGVRLVDQWCEIDGQPRRVSDILCDEKLHPLLSDEGHFAGIVYHRPRKK